MAKIKRIVLGSFFITLFIYIFVLIYKPPLPNTSSIKDPVIDIKPLQEKVEETPINLEFKGFNYLITPIYSYEIHGLIVEQYKSSNLLDIHHKSDPANTRDLCLVWGENITNGSYKKVKYSHGEFTCFYKWSKPVDPPFNASLLSNNHLIPANKEVAKEINKPNIGDQVRIKGYLANYKVFSEGGKEISERGTSVTRQDTGNGACEVIYVTEIQKLKGNNNIYYLLKGNLAYFILIIFVTLTGFFLLS